MSILLYPFKQHILKTSLTRHEVRDTLQASTYLSDKGFKKTGTASKLFYGNVSEFDFSLENISNNQNFVPFFDGELKGAENEIYVFMESKAFRHRRFYFVLLILVIFAVGFIANDLFHRQSNPFKDLPFVLGTGVLIVFVLFLFYQFQQFKKKAISTLVFFKELLKAEEIKVSEVPVIFR